MTVTLDKYLKDEKSFKLTSSVPTFRSFGDNKSPRVIAVFDKTPPSIVCPHFWEIRWAYGCPYDCAYCYLRGTFYGNKDPHYSISFERLSNIIDEAFQKITDPAIFNSGELSDSLMNPSLMERIADKFEEQDQHKLLLLTKSNRVDFLLRKPRTQTIVSFSLNAPTPAKRWEIRAPSPDERIDAARSVSEAGYETRVRIDPIFPISDWKKEYGELIYSLLSGLTPERITLGTPRGLLKTLRFSKDNSWTTFFGENSGWGKKISEPLRREIYQFHLDKLTELGFDSSKISLCKDTKEMWGSLGLNYSRIRCNCIW